MELFNISDLALQISAQKYFIGCDLELFKVFIIRAPLHAPLAAKSS